MVFINGVKYACATCIKGHRSTACHHSDRPLFLIKRKGRPITQCAHCRELRKTQKVHVKCTCNEKKEVDQQQQQQQPSNGSLNGGVESQFKIESPNFIEFNQQSSYEDKHSVEALLNPCKCTSGAKCICCRPVEQNSDMSANEASSNNLDLSYSSHPQIYDQYRMYPATAPSAMNRPTNMDTNHMSILQLANTLSTQNSHIPEEMFSQITMPMVPPAAPAISATPLQPASPNQNHSQYQRSFQNSIYDKLPTSTNPVPSWNGYVSDDGSSMSVSSEQREPRSSGHRRIASYPNMLYSLSKTEPQTIDAQPVETYPSYDEEETNIDESAVLGAQLCHSTSNDLVNMIYSSFRPRNTATSACHCGPGCGCQGCVIHPKRVNDGGMVLDVYASDSYQANSDSGGGGAIAGGCCSSSPDTVSNRGNASNNLCDSGNLCNTTSSQMPQSGHTVIVDEDGVLLCGCGCRKPNTECSDCVDSLCEEYLLKQPPM